MAHMLWWFMNTLGVNLGILFAFWLKDNKGLDFDNYVEKYKNDDYFRNEVNNQEEINEYREVRKNEKSQNGSDD